MVVEEENTSYLTKGTILCLEESYCIALLFHKVLGLKKLVTPFKITSFH